MSVVPLKLGVSIVESQDEFQKTNGFEGAAALIFNLDRDQFINNTSSNVSYDLRVGNEYRGHRDAEKTELGTSNKLLLRSGNAVLIQTEEVILLPRGLFGYVVPKVGLLQKGISNTLSKVDPGYNGPLIVTLFNLGRQDISLRRGDKFCSLVLHTVGEGAQLYNQPGKRISGNSRDPWWPRLKDWIEANRTWLTLASSVLMGLLGAVIALIAKGSGGPAR